MMQVIGQGMGILAVLLGFACFQMRSQRKLLIVQMMSTAAFCLHYYLIGAPAGLVMNMIGIVRNLVYCVRDRKPFSSRYVPVVFAVILGMGGLLAWEGPRTLLAVSGVVIHTLCLSLADPQKIRRSVLVSSPLLLVYNILVRSIGGSFYEAAAIVSSVIGMIRMGKAEKTQA